jgi:hypothetical protein
MYGVSGQVRVPGQICGHPVTGIASYCFARTRRLPEGEKEETCLCDESEASLLTELCGDVVEEVSLPEGVKSIGSCAFYNCVNLKCLQVGAAAVEIGSDAFMNAKSFHRLILCIAPGAQSGIRQILHQISWDVEVVFLSREGVEACLLYPEYYETYDEIAPAHIFGRSIRGEGFRARQCIQDGVVDFAGYDGIFQKACAEESPETLTAMAYRRLRYPYALGEDGKKRYESCIRSHAAALAGIFLKERDLAALRFLCSGGMLAGEELTACIRQAAESGWVQGAATLMQERFAQDGTD